MQIFIWSGSVLSVSGGGGPGVTGDGAGCHWVETKETAI